MNKSTVLRLGVSYMLISVLGFSLMNLTVKYLHRLPATELVFFRSVVSLTLSWITLRSKKIPVFGVNKKFLLLRGIFGVTALTLFFYTLQKMPLSSAVVIQYLSPIFTAFFAQYLLKEPMKPIQWFYFFLAFVGVAIVRGFDPHMNTTLLIAGVTSAVFSGLAYNCIRVLRHTDHPVVVVLYFPLVATPVMGLISWFNWVQPEGWEWLLLLAMGVLTQIAQVYMTRAYQVAEVGQVAGVKYLGILFALGFDLFLFGLVPGWVTLGGMFLTITAILLNINSHRRASRA